MNFEFIIFGCVILIILFIIACFYGSWLFFSRKYNYQQIYEILVNKYFTETINAFCVDYVNGQYLNVYVDIDTEKQTINFEEKFEQEPVMLNGDLYKSDPNHGKIHDIDNGFAVGGIFPPFYCPTNFRWDKELTRCTLQPICSNEPGTIKGINLQQWNALGLNYVLDSEVDVKNTTLYHPRAYFVCGEGDSYKIDICPANKLFNISTKSCEFYDICNEMVNGSRHHSQIGNDVILKDNQYYVCEKGVSVLKTCPGGDLGYYDENTQQCVNKSPCVDNDGQTYANNDLSYYLCVDGEPVLQSCPFGVIFNTINNRYECVNEECILNQTMYYVTDYLKVPVHDVVCINNVPTAVGCDRYTKVHTIAVPYEFNTEPAQIKWSPLPFNSSNAYYIYPGSYLENNECKPMNVTRSFDFIYNPDYAFTYSPYEATPQISYKYDKTQLCTQKNCYLPSFSKFLFYCDENGVGTITNLPMEAYVYRTIYPIDLADNSVLKDSEKYIRGNNDQIPVVYLVDLMLVDLPTPEQMKKWIITYMVNFEISFPARPLTSIYEGRVQPIAVPNVITIDVRCKNLFTSKEAQTLYRFVYSSDIHGVCMVLENGIYHFNEVEFRDKINLITFNYPYLPDPMLLYEYSNTTEINYALFSMFQDNMLQTNPLSLVEATFKRLKMSRPEYRITTSVFRSNGTPIEDSTLESLYKTNDIIKKPTANIPLSAPKIENNENIKE